jgi:ABC-type multidrug transport system fused ATPase/permease subunit
MLLYLGSHYDAVFTLTITVYVSFYMTIPYLYKKKIYQKNKVNREAQSLALNWLASLVNGWEVIRISKEPSTAFFNKKSEVAWSGVSGATIASSVVYGSLNSLQQFFHYVVLVTLCLIAVTYSGGHSSLKEEVLAFILYIDRYRAVASTAGSTPKIWSDFRLSMDRLSAIFGRQKNNIKYYPTPSAVGLELKIWLLD